MSMPSKEILLEQGYTKDQIVEIEKGYKEGLKVSLYMDKNFMAIQMRQIRLGLEEHLPVAVYAKYEYDWFQMEEIRKGLCDGTDTSAYADPQISYEKMRQIRRGLQHGIDLTDYLYLDAGILEQMRRAMMEGIDLLAYIQAGYDAEQLLEIRQALEKRIDINPFLLVGYRGDAIAQIRLGLEKGMDVSVYADIHYTWRQMREIRLGMESQVDIEKYKNRLYSWEQMREIRLGLEQGFCVDDYRKMRYTAGEMKKKRLMILARIKREQEEFENSQVKLEDFLIEITANGLEAYISVLAENKVINRDRLMEILQENGITVGIRESAVEKITREGKTDKPVLIAQGQIPHKGDDGWYEFFFRTDIEKKPKILKDGSVDYQNIDWFEIVQEGQKLAVYHPAKEGEDGHTVTGTPIQAQKGFEKSLLVGQGFCIEEDKRTYTATCGGMITLNDNKMEIVKHMELQDVTNATGNIRFDGSIHIIGNVGKGTVITAADDIVIDGFVEAAIIQSGGSVILKKGMNSIGRGQIEAKKDVISRFFEAVRVNAGGDIQVNKCLNSFLNAGGYISSASVITGGVAYAGKGFKLQNVGNQVGLVTVLQIGVDESLLNENKKISQDIQDMEHELQILEHSSSEFLEKYPPEVRNTMVMYKKIENSIFIQKKQLEKLRQQKMEIEKKSQKVNEAKVIIRGQSYEGTRFEFGGRRFQIGSQYNVTIKRDGGQMQILSNF